MFTVVFVSMSLFPERFVNVMCYTIPAARVHCEIKGTGIGMKGTGIIISGIGIKGTGIEIKGTGIGMKGTGIGMKGSGIM
jgi:hypothetical protein